MLLMNLLIVAAMGTGIGLSTRYFSPEKLQDNFGKGQKLYALGDYEKAIEHYEAILSIESNAMIEVGEVTVDVDEFILPVRVAASYQLGNTFNKLGLEKLRRSEFLKRERREREAKQRHEEALEDLNQSLEYFHQIIEDENIEERTRVMAQYQTLRTNYQLKDYLQVIREGEKLLGDFPNNVYETAVYYDMAWSYFELERYPVAIENFEQVLTLAPRGSSADRSIFQIADCYERLDQYDMALNFLDRLIARYDFSQMSEEELIEMSTLKLKGVVKETTRELVAKAQLKKGDIYAGKGEIEKALAAYAVVIEEYAAEPVLVQNAYIRGAELVHQERGTAAAIAAYKNAIEKVEDDKLFQARTQLTVARMLYDEEKYDKAAEEYWIYLHAYNDVAARIGFSRDKTLFRIAQSYQSYGQQVRKKDTAGSVAALDRSVSLYRQLLEEFSENDLIPDVLFGMAFTLQLKDQNAEAKPFFHQLVERYPEHGAAPSALMQIARIEYGIGNYQQANSLYQSLLDQYPDSDQRDAARMELGLTYKMLGNIEAAIGSFEAVEPGFGQWAKLQVDLAELYIGQQNYAQAEVVLSQALRKTEEKELQSQFHYIKARVHFAQADFEASIREFTRALEKSPAADIAESGLLARGSAFYEVAKQQDAGGDTASARVNYEATLRDMKELLQLDPAPHLKDSAFRTLGATMIRLDLQEEATRYYEELIDASDDPHEAATFQMLLTELYYDMEDFPQAMHHARKLLDLKFDDDNKAGYFRKERAYSIIGNSLLQVKQYREAASIFATGLQKYPQSGESGNLAFSRAFALFNAEDYETSAKSFEGYIKRFPQDRNRIHGHYYLGYSYQMLTWFKRAAAAFEVLAHRYPDSNYEEESLFLIGENYYNERDFERAAKAYEESLEQYPRGTYSASARYALAWSYFEQEKMEEGVKAMENVVQYHPESEFAAKAQFTLGDYYYNIRSYGPALEAYNRLVEYYPDSQEASKAEALVAELSEIQASFDYGEVMKFFEEKEYDKAIAGFEKIVEKYPGTYTELAAYCNLGLSYEIMRRWSEAAENYRKILEKGKDSPENSDVVSFAKQHHDWIVENRL